MVIIVFLNYQLLLIIMLRPEEKGLVIVVLLPEDRKWKLFLIISYSCNSSAVLDFVVWGMIVRKFFEIIGCCGLK